MTTKVKLQAGNLRTFGPRSGRKLLICMWAHVVAKQQHRASGVLIRPRFCGVNVHLPAKEEEALHIQIKIVPGLLLR